MEDIRMLWSGVYHVTMYGDDGPIGYTKVSSTWLDVLRAAGAKKALRLLRQGDSVLVRGRAMPELIKETGDV